MVSGTPMSSLILLGAALGVALLVYFVWLRPWQLRWGANDVEVVAVRPGDEVVQRPSFDATRAVTITAGPEHIWPWILQIGSGRAGWYSIDRIDNGGVPSAQTILPQYQRMEVGDLVPFTPDGAHGMWVKSFEALRWMLWWDQKGTATWLWQLVPLDQNNTRLISRLRVRYPWTSPWIVYYLAQDVGDIVMMRKCLLGIKRRAERLAQS